MDQCPHHNDCAHGAELRIGEDGRCYDCGAQLQLPDPRPTWRRPSRGWPTYAREPYERETTPDLYDLLVGRTATP